MDDELDAVLSRLIALAPGDGRINALVRQVCGNALSLPPLPASVAVGAPSSESSQWLRSSPSSSASTCRRSATSCGAGWPRRWASQRLSHCHLDVRRRLRAAGARGFRGVRSAGSWAADPTEWDHRTDPADVLFNDLLPAVARLRALDPVTSEIVRLRGASQHNCRLCKSLREGSALDSGGSEGLYAEIDRYETADALTDRHKAALRYVDALIWSPSHIGSDVADGVREHFSDAEAARADTRRDAQCEQQDRGVAGRRHPAGCGGHRALSHRCRRANGVRLILATCDQWSRRG